MFSFMYISKPPPFPVFLSFRIAEKPVIFGVLCFVWSFVSCIVITSMSLSLTVWISSCVFDWMPFMLICRTVNSWECGLSVSVVLFLLVWLLTVLMLFVFVLCPVVVVVLFWFVCVACVGCVVWD